MYDLDQLRSDLVPKSVQRLARCGRSSRKDFRSSAERGTCVETIRLIGAMIRIDRVTQMARHLPPISNYRAIASAIAEELRERYQPPNALSPELRRVLRQIPSSSLARRPQRHEMWLTDGETRRMAEISLRFVSR